MPPRSSGASSPTALSLIGSAVTLGLSFLVAVALVVAGDTPGDYFTSEGFQIAVASLIVLAAPLALLVSWGEFDLSVVGATAVGAAIAAGIADDPDGAVAAAVLLAAVVGALAGALLGLVRWLTRAHSALVSLGAGTLLTGFALMAGDIQGRPMARLDGSGLPILLAFVVVGGAVGLAAVFRDDEGDQSRTRAEPGPRTIAGFALSGLGSAAAGALFASFSGFVVPGQTEFLLVLGFAAVAVAGVVRRSSIAAPLLAVPGALVAILLQDGAVFNDWRDGQRELILGVAFVLGVAIAWGLQRLLGTDITSRQPIPSAWPEPSPPPQVQPGAPQPPWPPPPG